MVSLLLHETKVQHREVEFNNKDTIQVNGV